MSCAADALKRQRLDRRTLMPPPYTILYELAGEDGLAWSVALNDGISDAATSSNRTQFVGFATVPLQSPTAAVEELAARNADARPSRRRDSQQRRLAWDSTTHHTSRSGKRRAARRPILVHPNNVAGGERMGEYYLRNLIGNPD